MRSALVFSLLLAALTLSAALRSQERPSALELYGGYDYVRSRRLTGTAAGDS